MPLSLLPPRFNGHFRVTSSPQNGSYWNAHDNLYSMVARKLTKETGEQNLAIQPMTYFGPKPILGTAVRGIIDHNQTDIICRDKDDAVVKEVMETFTGSFAADNPYRFEQVPASAIPTRKAMFIYADQLEKRNEQAREIDALKQSLKTAEEKHRQELASLETTLQSKYGHVKD